MMTHTICFNFYVKSNEQKKQPKYTEKTETDYRCKEQIDSCVRKRGWRRGEKVEGIKEKKTSQTQQYGNYQKERGAEEGWMKVKVTLIMTKGDWTLDGEHTTQNICDTLQN